MGVFIDLEFNLTQRDNEIATLKFAAAGRKRKKLTKESIANAVMDHSIMGIGCAKNNKEMHVMFLNRVRISVTCISILIYKLRHSTIIEKFLPPNQSVELPATNQYSSSCNGSRL